MAQKPHEHNAPVKKHREEEHDVPHVHDESNWLVSYADMMTLLMGFFVLMYAFARVDEKKFEVVSKKVAKYFGGPVKDDPAMNKLVEEVKKVAIDELGKENVEVVANESGDITLSFDGAVLFESGSAQIKTQVLPTLDKISSLLTVQRGLDEVRVEGHTDSDAIFSKVFPSNWELSSARAGSVVRHFLNTGMKASKLVAEGYADSRPIAPEKDDQGNPIPENKARNRRVVINVSFASNVLAAQNALDSKKFVPPPQQARDPAEVNPFETTVERDTSSEGGGEEGAPVEKEKTELELAKERLKAREAELKEIERKAREKRELEQIQKRIQDLERKAAEKEANLQGINTSRSNGRILDVQSGMKQLENRAGKTSSNGAANGSSAKGANKSTSKKGTANSKSSKAKQASKTKGKALPTRLPAKASSTKSKPNPANSTNK